MNAINLSAQLSPREYEVAELLAWGVPKKEVADKLHISPRTVENHSRKIYEKTGVVKVGELSAWWFCTRFNISFDLSPIARRIIAVVLLAFVISNEAMLQNTFIRIPITKTCNVKKAGSSRRRDEHDTCYTDFI